MFTGATAFLARFVNCAYYPDLDSCDPDASYPPANQPNGTLNAFSGPPGSWAIIKNCAANHRVQSERCVPCAGGGIRAAGDDVSSGDTQCAFPDKAALKNAVDACLLDGPDPSGEACCSTDPDCTDPSSARCGSAGCVDMPDWDVSLVTHMGSMF